MSRDWPSHRIRLLGAMLSAGIAAGVGFSAYHWFTAPSLAKQKAKASMSQSMPGMTMPAPPQPVTAAPPLPPGLNEVALSPEQQVLAGVQTETIAPHALTHPIVAPGRITYDETRLAQVTARVDGRIERLYVNSTGSRVEKGRAMGAIYSPDLFSTEQEYLTALVAFAQAKRNPYPEVLEGARSLVEASKERLRLWGLPPEQIRQLERTRRPNVTIDLVAPRSGVVTKKQVVLGQYVKTGDTLYDVADLSRVWAEVEVFQTEMRLLRPGQPVEITTPSYQGRTFAGRLSFIYPFLSPESRTVRIRSELPNPHGLLKPDMLVTAAIQLPVAGPGQLAVPATAVLDTGRRQVVYVEVAPGTFRPREVRLGAKAHRYYPILSGLKAGEKVATSGGFLLDASSQIQSGGTEDMPGMAMPEKGAGK